MTNEDEEITLLELLDRALDKGIVVRGDLTISVAGIDLVYVGVQLLLSSVETAERMRLAATSATTGT